MESNQKGRCVACKTNLSGPYCHECGEKVLTEKDRSILTLGSHFISSFTFVDNKFYRTMKAFLLHPGQLSLAYIQGNRKIYILPISLFLMINLVFFLLNPVTDFNLSLYEQTHFQQYKDWANQEVKKKIAKRGIDYQTYEKIYNKRSGNLSRSLIVINVPILAIFIGLIYFRRDRFMVDHFVFALHLFAFLLMNFIIWGTVIQLIALWTDVGEPSSGISLGALFFIFVIIIYTYFAQQRFYNNRIGKGVINTILTVLALALVLWLYRLILFVVVLTVT